MDEKNDRYIVNGSHDAEKLASVLDVFIDKFVLCGECKNPETEFLFDKNDDFLKDCKACGSKTDVDIRHKLVGYIRKHKPKEKKYDSHLFSGINIRQGRIMQLQQRMLKKMPKKVFRLKLRKNSWLRSKLWTIVSMMIGLKIPVLVWLQVG
jgi:hypothetical protein